MSHTPGAEPAYPHDNSLLAGLQLAARLMCVGCDENMHVEYVTDHTKVDPATLPYWMHLESGTIKDGDWIDCDAGPILDRIESLKTALGKAETL